MSEHQHRSMAYLLEDVMKNKFNKAFYQEDLWKYVENKKIQEYDMKDVKHWIYAPCWSYNLDNTDCFYSIYQALIQKKKFKDDKNKLEADVSLTAEQKAAKLKEIKKQHSKDFKTILTPEQMEKYKAARANSKDKDND